MLINAKSLSSMPVISSDRIKYDYIDSKITEDGRCIESLIVRGQSLLDLCEYSVPTSFIKVIIPSEGIYLDAPSAQIEDWMMTSAPSRHRYSSFSGIGEDYETTHGVWDRMEDRQLSNYFSFNDFCNFKIDCLDEKLGKVRDIFFHPVLFTIFYFSVSTRWGIGRKIVFITSKCIEKLDWAQKSCYLSVVKRDIASGPLFYSHTVIDEDVEHAVQKHFNKINPNKSNEHYKQSENSFDRKSTSA